MRFNEWKEVCLGDISINIIDGDRGKKYPNGTDFTDIGYCLFLSAKNVTTLGFSFDQTTFITEQKDHELRNGKLCRHDVILTTRGTVGNVAYYSDNIPFNDMRINSGMVILRTKTADINSVYLYWLFRSPIIQEQILQIKTGSAQPQLPISTMKNLKFLRPPLPVQVAIAETLSCLDDKIQLNDRINKNLEAQAQAIFKSWFVDFEPFQDGEFVDSELGRIPAEWEVVSFTKYIKILGGGTPKTDVADYWNGDIPFFTPKDAINSFYSLSTEKQLSEHGVAKCNSRIFDMNTVFVTARGTVGKIALSGVPMAMNQSCYALISEKLGQIFVHQLTMHIIKSLAQKANGAVFSALVTRDFESEFVCIPPVEIIKKYTDLVLPLYDSVLSCQKQTNALSTLRDTLLPKLMSGEIQIPQEV